MNAATLNALYLRTAHGVKFDLTRTRAVCAAAGHPEERAPSVLIAGTNGKGSVAAMWAQALRHDGRGVGLFTSPHLVRFNERFVADGEAIDDDALDALYAELCRVEARTGITLTFFEAATVMAFLYFAARRVDAMVLEVGMGGRLDATNVVSPTVSLITSIGLDHEAFLGKGEAAIAREKAGVLRAGLTSAVGAVSDEAWRAISEVAEGCGARVVGLGRGAELAQDVLRYGEAERPLAPRLFGAHQVHNAGVFALSAALASGGPLALGAAAIAHGMQAAWPGRYQVILAPLRSDRDGVSRSGSVLSAPAAGAARGPGLLRIVLDGAHNPPAYAALAAAIASDTQLLRPRALVFGATEGREHGPGLAELARLFDAVVLCAPDTPRALSSATLLPYVPGARVVGGVPAALDAVRALGFGHACLTGSLYLVGEALAVLSGGARDTLSDFR